MTTAVTQRFTTWFDSLRLSIHNLEERPDTAAGDVKYVIKDVFTTLDGSWTPGDAPYSTPQWAGETYLEPGTFTKAFEKRNLYGAVLDEAGNFLSGHEFVYWTGGLERLANLGSTTNARLPANETPGWSTMLLFSSSAYDPASGQNGPWCWAPEGPADVICGGGLPNDSNVSTFVVWQAVPRDGTVVTPPPPVEPTPPPPVEPSAPPVEPTPPTEPPITPTPAIERRLGTWVDDLRLEIKPIADRPDGPSGDIVYLIKDVFTSRDGSWEPSTVYGAMDQWARDSYLKPMGDPEWFDDAGGDHHLFAAVLGLDGQKIKNHEVLYWSDGFDKLGDPAYDGYAVGANGARYPQTKDKSGWANIVMSPDANYVPERGEQGPWCWAPRGVPAEVICGGGMPAKQHVSVFVVWQAVPADQVTEPQPEKPTGGFNVFVPFVAGGAAAAPTAEPAAEAEIPPATTTGLESVPAIDQVMLDIIRRGAWNRLGIEYQPGSLLAAYARRIGLGMPVTPEFVAGGHRVQGFMGGIVVASVNDPERVSHMAW